MTTNIGNLQPLNEEIFINELESLDESARKERITSILKERNDVLDNSRKLFARAKQAEGFEQDDDGNWIKKVVVEKKSKADAAKPDEALMKRLDDMALRVAGITADDEKELFNKWKEQTGREADDIVGNSIFQKELDDLRTTKANQAATSDIKGEGSESSARSTPEYWLQRATKGPDGKPVFPEETPKELFPKILAKLAENEPGASKGKLKFYNQ